MDMSSRVVWTGSSLECKILVTLYSYLCIVETIAIDRELRAQNQSGLIKLQNNEHALPSPSIPDY